MSDDDLRRRIIRSMMDDCARGRALTESAPSAHLKGEGPCPECRKWIIPSDFGFRDSSRGKEVQMLVCAGCYVVLKVIGPGRFTGLTKRQIKRLPSSIRGFLDRNVEQLKALKGLLPH